MAPEPILEQQLREFDQQKYPSVEQTIVNNASVLYKRKKHFLQDLRQLMDGLGYVLIAMVYLMDLSMSGVVLRGLCHFSISNPVSHRRMASSDDKRARSCSMIYQITASNAFCFVVHLIWGAYEKSPSADNYLHGGISVQFIGEGLPSSRLVLLTLDLCFLFLQLVHHSLMLCTDDSEVLESKRPQLHWGSDDYYVDRSEIEGDGYSGNVMLIKIDLVENIRKAFDYDLHHALSTAAPPREPGMPSNSSLV